MSVNIHLALRVDKLESVEQAETVKSAPAEVPREHSIEREVRLRKFRDPISVKVTTGKWPLSVRGFGVWSDRFERDVKEAGPRRRAVGRDRSGVGLPGPRLNAGTRRGTWRGPPTGLSSARPSRG